ncbi:MAG: D-2-hydroxyacid dehydrogenase family protein [Acidimicrobiales bacterium]
MKIAILDDYLGTIPTLDAFSKLEGHDVAVFTDHLRSEDELAERLQAAEVLVLIRERTRLTEGLLERLEHLMLISQRGSYPHIDIETCSRLGILVCSNAKSPMPSYPTAELTWALLLCALRRLPELWTSVKAGTWQSSMGSTLRGKCLGIYGYGRIGRVVAGYATAFGMRVQVLGSQASLLRAGADGFALASTREAFFGSSDVVSLHLRLSGNTREIVTADDLALMKPSALMINTSRAELIERGALAAALKAGRPGFAAVDVYETEPVDMEEPLLTLPNVICTPHVGYVTVEEWEMQFSEIFDQINAFGAGAPFNVVNASALAHRPRRVEESTSAHGGPR